MKRFFVLLLCVLLVAAVPLCGCAEGGPVLSEFLGSNRFPTTYQAFLSETPAFPVGELISGGCMIRGLEAWGVTRDNMVRWELAANEWVPGKDPDTQYEDAAEFQFGREALPEEVSGITCSIVNPCGMYDEIAFSVMLDPAYPEEGNPGQVTSVAMKKGSVTLEVYPEGSYQYTLEPSGKGNEYSFNAFYSVSGELLYLSFYDGKKEGDGWRDARRATDPMTGETFYTVTLPDDSWTDPDNLPFELVPEIRIVSTAPESPPVAADPDGMSALPDLSREKAVRRNWPLKGIIPDAPPEVTAEQAGDKTVYMVRNLRDWGIGSQLGSTYVREDPENSWAQSTPTLDRIPSDQVRIITPLNPCEYTAYFSMEQEALTGAQMYGWASFDEETKELKQVYTDMQLNLQNGGYVESKCYSDSGLIENSLSFETDDGWEIRADYRDGVLYSYVVWTRQEDGFYDWVVQFDETGLETTGRYDTLFFSNDDYSVVKQYKYHPDEGQWYTDSFEENFVPEPCDPPEKILQRCPLLPVTD